MFDLNNIQDVTPEEYPHLPCKMQALGNVELLEEKSLAVAGSRKIDEVSSYWLVQAISELPSDWVVTSGLALGTDAIAHRASMVNDLPTIAVLPSGIGNIVPRTNIKIAKEIVLKGGLLLSEYPIFRGINDNYQYIKRNKIIVDISKSLLVPQFDKESGTRSTVDFARDAGKLIITQCAKYSGNQYIINDGSYKTFIK